MVCVGLDHGGEAQYPFRQFASLEWILLPGVPPVPTCMLLTSRQKVDRSLLVHGLGDFNGKRSAFA